MKGISSEGPTDRKLLPAAQSPGQEHVGHIEGCHTSDADCSHKNQQHPVARSTDQGLAQRLKLHAQAGVEAWMGCRELGCLGIDLLASHLQRDARAAARDNIKCARAATSG